MATKTAAKTAGKRAKTNWENRDPFKDSENDPDYKYAGCITTWKENPYQLEQYEERGWEIVYSDEAFSKDDTNHPNKDHKTAKRPVTRTTKGGHTEVKMRMLKTVWEENQKADDEERKQLQSGKTTLKSGGSPGSVRMVDKHLVE